jgi:hypothetical protein
VVIDKCLEAEKIPADTVISRAEEEDKMKSFGPLDARLSQKKTDKIGSASCAA